MAIEPKRGCGFRKVGGLYLVCRGGGVVCDRLPIPLIICPTCGAGIKQTRGWTWVDVFSFVGGDHPRCEDSFPCPICMGTARMGKAGLLWIGQQFYGSAELFTAEAECLGISRRISTIPRGFELGKTWVMLAHPTAAQVDGEKAPGIFRIFIPDAIECIVTASQSKDPEYMSGLEKRGITPVIVPDNDRDHQRTVYDDEEERPGLF